MKQVKRLLSLVIALTMAFGIFAFTAQAKSKAAPLSLDVEVSSFDSGYTGLVTVAVTVKNTSSKDVKNIVVTSCGSTGLCMYSPIDKNVVITNPGSKPVSKKNAMAACLKPGGTMKYVYCVLLGYQYAKNKVPEATRVIMLEQHKLLKTKNFRPLSIKANYVESKGNLTFGSIKTTLDVKAYYNVKAAAYEKIAGGSSVVQNKAVKTNGNYDTSASSSSTRNTSSALSSVAAIVNSVAKNTTTRSASSTATSYDKENARKTATEFIYNKNTGVFHTTDCSQLEKMDENNKKTYSNTSYDEMKNVNHFKPCSYCLGE